MAVLAFFHSLRAPLLAPPQDSPQALLASCSLLVLATCDDSFELSLWYDSTHLNGILIN